MAKLYAILRITDNDEFVRIKINGVFDAFVTTVYADEIIGEIYLN